MKTCKIVIIGEYRSVMLVAQHQIDLLLKCIYGSQHFIIENILIKLSSWSGLWKKGNWMNLRFFKFLRYYHSYRTLCNICLDLHWSFWSIGLLTQGMRLPELLQIENLLHYLFMDRSLVKLFEFSLDQTLIIKSLILLFVSLLVGSQVYTRPWWQESFLYPFDLNGHKQ